MIRVRFQAREVILIFAATSTPALGPAQLGDLLQGVNAAQLSERPFGPRSLFVLSTPSGLPRSVACSSFNDTVHSPDYTVQMVRPLIHLLERAWKTATVPVGSTIFSSPRRPDLFWGHPVSYPMSTEGYFPGGKAVTALSWQLTPTSAEIKKPWSIHPLSHTSSWRSA
jgi:hypothetical protein